MRAPRQRDVGLAAALLPVVVLVGALSVYILVLDLDDLAIVPVIIGAVAAAAVARFHGHGWREIEEGMVHGIALGINAILILLAIGILIGTWMLGGIVPAMIFYGVKLLSPGFFLLASMLICSIVSLGTGSSWSTAGTFGLALVAVGDGLGIPAPMVAGAVVSGAYFGDKMSPLSDTTNLAPAVAGGELFSHIRHMAWTTVPAYVFAATVYAILGLRFAGGTLGTAGIDGLVRFLSGNFVLTPILLLAPALVIALVVARVPALPAVLCGAAAGGVFAVFEQGRTVAEVFRAAFDYGALLQQLGAYDFSMLLSTREVDALAELARRGMDGAPLVASLPGVSSVLALLSKGGVVSMLPTVGLIMAALSFGGIMERTGMLERIARALLRGARSTGSLIAATAASSIAMNVIGAEQYMSIVVPGRMFRDAYRRRGFDPKNLSRVLEDSGTMTSALVPWNSCGAFMAAALGVTTLAYLPFAFLNLATPVISVAYGFLGWTIVRSHPIPLVAESPDETERRAYAAGRPQSLAMERTERLDEGRPR